MIGEWFGPKQPRDEAADLRDYAARKQQAGKFGIKIDVDPPGTTALDRLASFAKREAARLGVTAQVEALLAPKQKATARSIHARAPADRRQPRKPQGRPHDGSIAKLRSMAAKARAAGDHITAGYLDRGARTLLDLGRNSRQ